MNKNEMIQLKIAEIVKDKFPTIYAYCRKASAEEIETELWLTKKQKQRLTEALTALKNATGHKYSTLTYIKDDPSEKKVFLGFYTMDGELQKKWHYDMISGILVSFADEVFINHQEYRIEYLMENASSPFDVESWKEFCDDEF